MATTTTNELIICNVSRDGVVVAVNGENKFISWTDLRSAASPQTLRGFPIENETSKVYGQLLSHACTKARKLKSVTIRVHSRTGGATWVADTLYVSGEHAGHPAGVGYADGMDAPHRSYAVREAHEAAGRLRSRGYDVEIVECKI